MGKRKRQVMIIPSIVILEYISDPSDEEEVYVTNEDGLAFYGESNDGYEKFFKSHWRYAGYVDTGVMVRR